MGESLQLKTRAVEVWASHSRLCKTHVELTGCSSMNEALPATISGTAGANFARVAKVETGTNGRITYARVFHFLEI